MIYLILKVLQVLPGCIVNHYATAGGPATTTVGDCRAEGQ
jgi:hypothetical protein